MLEYIIQLSEETNIPATDLTKYYYLVKKIVVDERVVQEHMNNNFKHLRYDSEKNKNSSYCID